MFMTANKLERPEKLPASPGEQAFGLPARRGRGGRSPAATFRPGNVDNHRPGPVGQHARAVALPHHAAAAALAAMRPPRPISSSKFVEAGIRGFAAPRSPARGH